YSYLFVSLDIQCSVIKDILDMSLLKALFRRRMAWPNLELLEVRTCGLWSVEFEQSRRSYYAWLGKYLGSARVNGSTDVI
ncbi:hypothetical protein AVEN_269566-2-1, partial [Araneus ventricosus]